MHKITHIYIYRYIYIYIHSAYIKTPPIPRFQGAIGGTEMPHGLEKGDAVRLLTAQALRSGSAIEKRQKILENN